ncbi:MAG: glycosyl transferase family 2 [Acidimicrobiales bacterium]|jgi:glycosyltransferase involved in cell wall biosynthesis|nr:glycosyl transferase family 2 [Acidimicrobiales bacterium]
MIDGPELSVVVPTYRRPELLIECLQSLERQRIATDLFEVVVVDDGSGDATGEVLAAAARVMPNLTPIVQPVNRGPAAARNEGIRQARGSIVVFLDDDIAAAPDLLARHARFHADASDPNAGLLGIVQWHPRLDVTPFMRWLDASGLQFGYDTWLRDGPVEPPYAAFYTANLSMGRALLLDCGGFDERFPYPAYEDFELAYRLTQIGFRMEYDSNAVAFHTRAIDLATFRSRMAKVGESAELLRKAQPDFPLDDSWTARFRVRRRERLRLRARAPFAARSGKTDVLARHYGAEVTAGYDEGRRRAGVS